MSEVLRLLKRHRSIRKFTDQSISQSHLRRLIQVGQAASTSSYIQSVSVVRVSQLEQRKAFAEIAGGQSYIESAAEFLVFCADLHRNRARVELSSGEVADFGWVEQFIAATVDVGLFAQNVVVAAEADGLGCCYIGGIRNDPEQVTRLLDLPELVYPVFGLCLGHPDQDPAIKPRLPVDAVLHDGSYQTPEVHQEILDQYDTNVKQYYLDRTKGKLSFTWSDQMAKQAETQKRQFMGKYLRKQGFIKN